jgi:DNA mismatch repair protein MutS
MADNKNWQAIHKICDKFFELKEKYPNSMIMFRIGDFYYFFRDDALKAQEILDLPVQESEWCAVSSFFPCYQLDTICPKLIRHGCRVAISDL